MSLVGDHRAIVVGAALGMTSTGKEQVAISFDVVDDQNQSLGKIAYYGTFTDAAFQYTVQNLRTSGWTGDDLSDLTMVGGQEVWLVIGEELYEGKRKEKVKFINPPGGAGGAVLKDQLDESRARAFAARMKSSIRALEASQGAPKASGKPPPRAKSQDPESDIPF